MSHVRLMIGRDKKSAIVGFAIGLAAFIGFVIFCSLAAILIQHLAS